MYQPNGLWCVVGVNCCRH